MPARVPTNGRGISTAYSPKPVTVQSSIYINVRSYGAKGDDSTDDTAAIQAALTAVINAGGGTVFFPPGQYRYTALSLNGSTGPVVLTGVAGRSSGAAGLGASGLLCTANSARAIDLRGSYGVSLRDLRLLNLSAFTGTLIDAAASAHLSVRDCYIGGNSTRSAAILLSLANAEIVKLADSTIGGCQVGIQGRGLIGDFSNVVTLDNVDFSLNSVAVACTKNAGQAWSFRSCTFEALFGNAAGAYTYDTDFGSNGTVFDGCWFGDASASGTHINWTGGGLDVRGCCIFSGATGVAIGHNSIGALVKGNSFDVMTNGISLGASCANLDLQGNFYNTVTNPVIYAAKPASAIMDAWLAGSVDWIDVFGYPRRVGGTPSDANFVIPPENGTPVIDISGGYIYVRIAGTWKKVAVT